VLRFVYLENVYAQTSSQRPYFEVSSGPALAIPPPGFQPLMTFRQRLSFSRASARERAHGLHSGTGASEFLRDSIYREISDLMLEAKISSRIRSRMEDQGTRLKSVCAKSAHCTLFADWRSSCVSRIANFPEGPLVAP
jgi:hypothetical protein